MEKTLTFDNKEMKFKSSAATNILYKRAFKEDILIKLTAYSKDIKEFKAIQAKVDALKNDTSKTKEEIASEMSSLMSSGVFESITSFSNDTLPKLAYIMFLEANEGTDTIFSKLTEEKFLSWLMTIDQDDLREMTGEVMELWQNGAKGTSKPKN